MHNTQTNYLIV